MWRYQRMWPTKGTALKNIPPKPLSPAKSPSRAPLPSESAMRCRQIAAVSPLQPPSWPNNDTPAPKAARRSKIGSAWKGPVQWSAAEGFGRHRLYILSHRRAFGVNLPRNGKYGMAGARVIALQCKKAFNYLTPATRESTIWAALSTSLQRLGMGAPLCVKPFGFPSKRLVSRRAAPRPIFSM